MSSSSNDIPSILNALAVTLEQTAIAVNNMQNPNQAATAPTPPQAVAPQEVAIPQVAEAEPALQQVQPAVQGQDFPFFPVLAQQVAMGFRIVTPMIREQEEAARNRQPSQAQLIARHNPVYTYSDNSASSPEDEEQVSRVRPRS